MTQIAFVKTDDDSWLPCLVSEIKKNAIFYVVNDGKQGDIRRAVSAPSPVNLNAEQVWTIESVPYE